ncbi:MAG TPA: DUF3106 domain-containing protein [Candidatus Acidoferrum sp.]|nr:DUF3106 domain-containing protein [Candidatus Acidoferrum sp.]
MSGKLQIGKWVAELGICVALATPSFAQVRANAQQNRPPQNRHEQKEQKHQQQAEHQQRQQEKQQRQQGNQAQREAQRNVNRPPQSNAERTNPAPRPNGNANRPPSAYTPPARMLTPQERQKNEQQFNRLPPQQKQEMRDRAQTWQKLTPQQKNHIKNDVLPKWQQLPSDRQRAIRSRLNVLKNMPESARNQHLNDPNFTRGMSEEDKAMLHDLSHLHVGGAPEPPPNE